MREVSKLQEREETKSMLMKWLIKSHCSDSDGFSLRRLAAASPESEGRRSCVSTSIWP